MRPPKEAPNVLVILIDDVGFGASSAFGGPCKTPVAERLRLWLIEATKYNVLPLDDRGTERVNPDIAGRPQLIRGERQLLFGGMGRLTEHSVLNIKNRSYAVTAKVVVPEGGVEGVMIALRI